MLELKRQRARLLDSLCRLAGKIEKDVLAERESMGGCALTPPTQKQLQKKKRGKQ